jgi:hypothetical protein
MVMVALIVFTSSILDGLSRPQQDNENATDGQSKDQFQP